MTEIERRSTSPTWVEIHQQPETWLSTRALIAVHAATSSIRSLHHDAIITGAGTSAYAAGAIQAAWPNARAIPTTDIMMEAKRLPEARMMLSIARSGNSPESIGAVERVQQHRPSLRQFAITCNADGQLAKHPGITSIVLDPRTNDRGLAMTSSFSNLVLAGLCITHGDELGAALPAVCANVASRANELSEHAERMASSLPQRVVVLASPQMFACAREAGLKILELTAGKVAVLTETFLGVRHGPMSFLDAHTLVLAFLSSDQNTRRYEEDVLAELRAKKLGKLVGLMPEGSDASLVDEAVPSMAASLPDFLRTPFDIVYAQLLAYHLSVRAGLDPDNPSPGGVITRVVQGFTLYPD
jgi:tagatose-6-phosphate ketose/aldose isomerase